MAPSEDVSDLDVNCLAGIEALASNLSDIRAQKASSRPAVPDEIWYKIWKPLPLDDRLAVARVCAVWRRIAHAQRSLWNHLNFTTSRHQRSCQCNTCEPRDGVSYSSDVDTEDWLWNVSNLHHAARVLSLSGDLELHITLEVQTHYALSDELVALGTAMAPHAGRIVALGIRTGDTYAYYTFLAHFESLPALVSFSANLMGYGGRRPYGASFAPVPLRLPALETVRLNRGFSFPTPQIGRTFPRARGVAIAPALSVAGEVSQALAACPTVDSFALHLRVFSWPAPSGDTAAAIRQRASALRAVMVSGIRLDFEHWVLDALAHPALQTLALEYDSLHDIALGWSVFASLTGSLTLRVTMKNRWPECAFPTSDSVLCAQMVDAHGRTRRLALHRCAWDDAEAALARLSGTPPLHAIVAPYALWPLVRRALAPRALDAATLVVSTHNEAVGGQEDGGEDVPLRSLTLIYDGPGTLSLSAARLEHLIRRARVRLPLDVLTLDRRLATCVPDGLARTVVIASCALPHFPMPAPLRDETRDGSDPASGGSDPDESD